MVDRQDIDALLVGALYGELTPADEARLAAHLESHPGDRTALEDLKTARHAVRESRIFEVQHEPPQAVSALLLQEAHRRAPKAVRAQAEEREGWFARLTRSFFAHPAMAAAAMLVVVVGVAGTLYMRKGGDELAIKEVSGPAPTISATENAFDQTGGTPPAAAPAAAEPGQGMANAGSSGYQVGLAEGKPDDGVRTRELQKESENQRARIAETRADKSASLDGDMFTDRKAVAHAGAKPSPKAPVAITTPQLQPKDIGGDAPKKKSAGKGGFAADLEDETIATGRAGGGAGTAGPRGESAIGAGNAPAAAPTAPPPPPSKAPARAQIAQDSAPSTATVAPAPGKNDAKSDPLTEWGRKQLAAAITASKSDNCNEAAKIVLDIRNKAPAFYAENVADNRNLKGCASYIRNGLDKSEERSKKMAPSKLNNDVMK